MYSLILMAALSSAPDQQDFNGFFRRLFSLGGHDCHGSDCYGSARHSSGCYGSDKYSCYGSKLRAFNDSGSCYGSTSRAGSSCYGSASFSCFGSREPEYAAPRSATSLSPAGCYGTSSGYSLGTPQMVGDPFAFNGFTMPNLTATPYTAMPPGEIPDNLSSRRVNSSSEPLSNSPNRAKVIVRLPADAKLYAEGRALQLTSSTREFTTPVLPREQEFFYTFRAEYIREGETISQSKRVSVKAGGTFTVEFTDLTLAKLTPKMIPDATGRPNPLPLASLPNVDVPPVLSSGAPKTVSLPTGEPITRNLPKNATPTANSTERAKITVKLAPGAVLYVDGKRNERSELVRDFTTPPLPQGQEFAYLMKSELMRNGQPETQVTKVTFRAGELVNVDFTTPAEKK